jgi:hypothetical protein
MHSDQKLSDILSKWIQVPRINHMFVTKINNLPPITPLCSPDRIKNNVAPRRKKVRHHEGAPTTSPPAGLCRFRATNQ